MSESAERPRPQYGEYATPEEQRARIAGPVPPELEGRPAIETPQQTAPASVPAPPADAPTEAESGAPARPRIADRIVTFVLLGWGLATVITSIPAITDYAGYAATMFELLGVDAQLADPDAGRPWALAAALLLGLGWIATAALSWWNLRRRRVTWWIPVVGGIVFNLVSSTLILVPLLSDPGFQSAILEFSVV